MKLWYEPKGSSVPNEDLRRKQIPESLVEEGYGFFLGRRTKPSELTYDDILTRFDRLLPLYEYIEENLDAEEFPNGNGSTGSSQGATNSDRKYQTTAEQSKTKVDIDLRHNRMQDVLETELAAKHGTENIHAEAPTEQGRSVDLVVQTEDGKWFYEIKPFNDPRLCFRKAVGQLLEYAFWSRSEVPERLIVVGRSELGEEGEAYLSTLKEQFSLPLEYQSLQVPVASS
jgi:hypothetical protein